MHACVRNNGENPKSYPSPRLRRQRLSGVRCERSSYKNIVICMLLLICTEGGREGGKEGEREKYIYGCIYIYLKETTKRSKFICAAQTTVPPVGTS